MGRSDVTALGQVDGRVFTRAVLRDLEALARMLSEGLFEADVRRIGAEQELFFVDAAGRPVTCALDVLQRLPDGPFTTELAQFNLEINAPPFLLDGDVFGRLERELAARLEEVEGVARSLGARVALVGILPTIEPSDLAEANMTPLERYRVLAEALSASPDRPSDVHIRGIDELLLPRDTPTIEACNTSFQVHLQVGVEEFARVYNAAQLVLGPVLAVSANSPMLLGRRLWSETRIALFEQTMTGGERPLPVRGFSPRVRFGERWVDESAIEVFHEDVARFPIILGTSDPGPDPVLMLDEGQVPELAALQIFNSTVYRWNRPCYGITGGQPHLRIECRVLPSGPTLVDEVANAMLWIGSVLGAAKELPPVSTTVPFSEAAGNFVAAARRGLGAGFTWYGRTVAAPDLVREVLIPLARSGLVDTGVDPDEVYHYLGVIEERARTEQTGARWATSSLRRMGGAAQGERMSALTRSMLEHQASGEPVARWPLAEAVTGPWYQGYRTVSQCMQTDLFTVSSEAAVDLPAFMMKLRHIRQVPVEDADHRLVGVVDFTDVLDSVGVASSTTEPTAVADIMSEPLTVAPNTSTIEAIGIMREHDATSLLVVDDGRLVGILSVTDLLPVVEHALTSLPDAD